MNNKVDALTIMNTIGEAKQFETLVLGEGENAVEIIVARTLTVGSRTHLVNSIVDMVIYGDDEDEVVYAPALRHFAISFNLLNYFTNIELPDDTESVRKFIECTDIVNRVLEVLPEGYFNAIIREADLLIEYKKQQALKATKLDNVLNAVLDVIKTVKEQTKKLDLEQTMELVNKYAPAELKAQLVKLIDEHKTEGSVE